MKQRRDRLISFRKELKLTQKEVVELLKRNYEIEIAESFYGMIEQGVRTPKLIIAFALASLFETNVNEIFFENEPNEKLLFSILGPWYGIIL